MTMTNCMAFHTQIASVMEVLANAAVAEICKLVDNDYAVFRLEISQSQKENRGLRRKLQVLELKMARDRAERTMRERLLANRPNVTTVKIHDRFRGAKGEGHLLGSHRGLGKPVVHSVWKDNPPISVAGGETSSQGIITIEESADADDADSGSSLVKQGRSDSEERQLHSRDTHASAPPSATEDITAPAWTRRCVTEVSGMDTVLKSETQTETLPLTHRLQQHTRSDLRSDVERLGCPDSEYLFYETQSPTALSGRDRDVLETGNQASCSNAIGDSERQTDRMRRFSNQHSHNASTEALAIDEVTVKVEGDAPLSWNAETHVTDGHSLGNDLLDYRESLEMSCSDLATHSPLRALTRDQNSASKISPLDVRDHAVLLDPIFTSNNRARAVGETGCKEKRFHCTLCGKGFSCPKKVEIHQRVHTGEKPFSCTQCRMSFAQSGNLKRHQRVHTGEKPFSCTQCEKRFSHLHQLKMHMKVHTGERPFVCTYCGKRFAERSYLKIHQQKHHPV